MRTKAFMTRSALWSVYVEYLNMWQVTHDPERNKYILRLITQSWMKSEECRRFVQHFYHFQIDLYQFLAACRMSVASPRHLYQTLR